MSAKIEPFPTPPHRYTDGSLKAMACAICLKENPTERDRAYLKEINEEMARRTDKETQK